MSLCFNVDEPMVAERRRFCLVSPEPMEAPVMQLVSGPINEELMVAIGEVGEAGEAIFDVARGDDNTS